MKAVNLEKLLPSDIPQGERVLWFGRPDATSLWRRAYRADWVGAWFVVMTVWNFTSGALNDGPLTGLIWAVRTLGFGAAALAILAFLAWLSTRNTLYVVTQQRIVIKTGIALPLFINVPFKQIGSANVRMHSDGTGDVPVGLTQSQRIPYLALWPSARPLRFTKSEPTLRCIPDARTVAETLGRALYEASGQSATAAPARAPAKASEAAFAATAVA